MPVGISKLVMNMDDNNTVEEMDFEAALAELEAIVSRLEIGELSLEEALTVFERGQQLASYCSRLLNDATLRVERLTDDGEIAAIEIDG